MHKKMSAGTCRIQQDRPRYTQSCPFFNLTSTQKKVIWGEKATNYMKMS